ncbi:hypothetical protein JAAARDRAFT_190373 [Jaapia argillacea MUCL 33604]|uniref:Uncharacterized protein n=1 Tax=Jaapia argillacea MUCL 33604 TaxID=933084 RepID=A0A067Q3J9_9AGAM|nr:hypothetical protein JAAARDRAFT_190373 [Jaapia argillacea MUCL 33604]
MALLSWHPIITYASIPNVLVLQTAVATHEEALVDTVCSRAQTQFVDRQYKQVVKKLDYLMWHSSHRNQEYSGLSSARAGEAQLLDGPLAAEILDIEATNWEEDITDPVLAEGYSTLRQRTQPPPRGGYHFPKADHVKSPTHPPPSPCKCCSSALHWDKECPYYMQFEALRKKSVNLTLVKIVTSMKYTM